LSGLVWLDPVAVDFELVLPALAGVGVGDRTLARAGKSTERLTLHRINALGNLAAKNCAAIEQTTLSMDPPGMDSDRQRIAAVRKLKELSFTLRRWAVGARCRRWRSSPVDTHNPPGRRHARCARAACQCARRLPGAQGRHQSSTRSSPCSRPMRQSAAPMARSQGERAAGIPWLCSRGVRHAAGISYGWPKGGAPYEARCSRCFAGFRI
jgi:hypothetical protein